MSAPADKKIKTWQRAGAVVLALSVWQAASWAVGSALLRPGPGTVLGRDCIVYPTSCVRGVIPERSIFKNSGAIAPREERM